MQLALELLCSAGLEMKKRPRGLKWGGRACSRDSQEIKQRKNVLTFAFDRHVSRAGLMAEVVRRAKAVMSRQPS